ncbi:hypothetical protein D9M72_451490 [compost metagenome]
MRVVVFAVRALSDALLALLHILRVVQVAAVGRHTVVIALVFGAGHFFAAQQRFVELLTMASADFAHFVIGLAHQFQDGLRENLHRGGGRFLHKDVAVVAVLEGMQHQFDRIFQSHHETGHGRVGHGDGLARQHLLHEQRDDRAAGGHDVAVAGAADDGVGAFQISAGGNHHFFHHGLADAHGVDGIDRLVGAKADNTLYARSDCGFKDVFSAENVGADCLHGVELAGRHLLERCSVKNVVSIAHCRPHAPRVPYIADIELQLGMIVALAHVILFFFISAEDSNFPNTCM